MFVIELLAPFAILLPARFRRVRTIGFGLLCAFQVLIAATGNYGFFNLLTVVLYVSMLDDDATGASLAYAHRGQCAAPPFRNLADAAPVIGR